MTLSSAFQLDEVLFFVTKAGLKINPDRPNKKLPYRGAWLWIGSEMIHLMELPNPDPLEDRPEHGGRDRHFCIGIEDLDPLIESLDQANVEYTKSMSGRRAVFFRDPGTGCRSCHVLMILLSTQALIKVPTLSVLYTNGF